MAPREVLLILWFMAFFLEEVREVSTSVGLATVVRVIPLPTHVHNSFGLCVCVQAYTRGVQDWWTDAWNRLDLLIVVLHFMAFGFRVSDLTSTRNIINSKTCMSMNIVLMYFRSAHYYEVSEIMGPKVSSLM